MNEKSVMIILAALLIGLTASFSSEIYEKTETQIQELELQQSDNHKSQAQDGYKVGSAHEHALFYIVNNDTELSFKEQKYQLAAPYVHLESNRSDIVHKHAEGVTWNDFLDTINASVNQSEERVCAEIKNTSYCGGGAISLNGGDAGLEQEITQGDRLVIVLQENYAEILKQYNSKQLPRAYKPESTRGRRL